MMNWICAQIGAREHYAIPRVLQRAGKLEALYTDFWATAGWRMAGKLAGKSSLSTRYHPELANARAVGFNLQALQSSLSRNKATNPYDEFLRVGRTFGLHVARSLESSNCHIFFGYDTGFLEPAERVKARGGKTIVCQMDPSRFEVDLVKEEGGRWPGWAKRSAEVPEAYFQRREQEWALADLVMVNSEWTKAALIKQGVSEDKLVVVPLAYEFEKSEALRLKTKKEASKRTFTQKQPLRVLFLGQVILRKGIQYLMEAAKLSKDQPVHFDVVGSIGISDEALASAPSNMTFHGPVSRDRTEEFYRSADIFVLPTLSDGFALTQLEAMAHGLPVIATPNCGDAVTDGVDGLIVPARDAKALAEAIQSLIEDPERLQRLSDATGSKLEQFSLSKLDENLTSLESIAT